MFFEPCRRAIRGGLHNKSGRAHENQHARYVAHRGRARYRRHRRACGPSRRHQEGRGAARRDVRQQSAVRLCRREKQPHRRSRRRLREGARRQARREAAAPTDQPREPHPVPDVRQGRPRARELHDHRRAREAGRLQHPVFLVGPAVSREEGRAEIGRPAERPARRRGQGHDQRDHAAREIPEGHDRRVRRHAVRVRRAARRQRAGHHAGRPEADRPARERARQAELRDPGVHDLERLHGRRRAEGRDAPARLRQRHAEGARGERPRDADLRRMVRADDENAAHAHFPDRRQDLIAAARAPRLAGTSAARRFSFSSDRAHRARSPACSGWLPNICPGSGRASC
ncbi:hypothetical protein BCEN4_1050020 [Burkholderia cenocepacia]|nr:hypothetical protein BCEN4_1050020 [Burkholderia cenocepacia]